MPLQREVLPPVAPTPWGFTTWIASGILTCCLLFVAIALVGIATESGRRSIVSNTGTLNDYSPVTGTIHTTPSAPATITYSNSIQRWVGPTPAVTSCGEKPIVGGNDYEFYVVPGEGALSCDVTFATSFVYPPMPLCQPFDENERNFPTLVATSTHVVLTNLRAEDSNNMHRIYRVRCIQVR